MIMEEASPGVPLPGELPDDDPADRLQEKLRENLTFKQSVDKADAKQKLCGSKAYFGWDSNPATPRANSATPRQNGIKVVGTKWNDPCYVGAKEASDTCKSPEASKIADPPIASPMDHGETKTGTLQKPATPDKSSSRIATPKAIPTQAFSLQDDCGSPSDEQARAALIDWAKEDPSFKEALARQGLVLADLKASSGISPKRRASLLRSVFREQDALQRRTPEPIRGASVLKRQVYQRIDDLASTVKAHREHNDAVHKKYQEMLDRQIAWNEERGRQNERRSERVHEQETVSANHRRERSHSREARWQATVAQGNQNAASFRADRAAFMSQQDARVKEALAQRDASRERKRQQLEEHAEKVQHTLEWSRRDEELRCLQVQERLEASFKRSEEHQEHRRREREAYLEEKEHKEFERNHEVLRVQRMQEYERERKRQEHRADSATFEHCQQIKNQIASIARQLAARSSSSAS